MVDGIRTGGKGIRAPKFLQVGQSLADISFFKFCMLDVAVIGNTNFHRKDIDLKITQLVKTPLYEHMEVGCSGSYGLQRKYLQKSRENEVMQKYTNNLFKKYFHQSRSPRHPDPQLLPPVGFPKIPK